MPMIDVYAPSDLLPPGTDRRGLAGTAFGRPEFAALAEAAEGRSTR
jgi:hypothetical protein